jgi:hypothetical protein
MTMDETKRYLEFVNFKTGEIGHRIDVTDRPERFVEKCLHGMLINIGPDWFVRDTADIEEPLPSTAGREG